MPNMVAQIREQESMFTFVWQTLKVLVLNIKHIQTFYSEIHPVICYNMGMLSCSSNSKAQTKFMGSIPQKCMN